MFMASLKKWHNFLVSSSWLRWILGAIDLNWQITRPKLHSLNFTKYRLLGFEAAFFECWCTIFAGGSNLELIGTVPGSAMTTMPTMSWWSCNTISSYQYKLNGRKTNSMMDWSVQIRHGELTLFLRWRKIIIITFIVNKSEKVQQTLFWLFR